MAASYSLPDLLLDDGHSIPISLEMLHEVYTEPSAATIQAAADARLDIMEFRERVYTTLVSHLAERRPAQKVLLDYFIPGNLEGVQAPMMNYGFAMSNEAMLYCAEKLNIRLPRDVYKSGTLIYTFKADSMGYNRLMRGLLTKHLERCGDVPAGTIMMEPCFGQSHLHIFSFFSNYDVRYKRERARPYSKRSIDDIRVELKKGFEGFESGPRPRLMWHWDANKCGFEYAAPWDEYNLVPRALTPDWQTDFDAETVETTEDAHKPPSPRGRRSSRKAETQSSR